MPPLGAAAGKLEERNKNHNSNSHRDQQSGSGCRRTTTIIIATAPITIPCYHGEWLLWWIWWGWGECLLQCRRLRCIVAPLLPTAASTSTTTSNSTTSTTTSSGCRRMEMSTGEGECRMVGITSMGTFTICRGCRTGTNTITCR